MNKVISLENVMRAKVRGLLDLDFRPSEVADMLNIPIEKVHKWMAS